MKRLIVLVVLAVLLVFSPNVAYAIPSLPHAFYGTVTINGNPAPDGTKVSAVVDKGDILPTQNPVITVNGDYGTDGPKLLVQGDITPGTTITFCVEGVVVEDVVAKFEAGGGPTQRDLSVDIEPAKPTNGGDVESPYNRCSTDFCGLAGSFRIDRYGKVLRSTTASCVGGALSIAVEEDTVALDGEGKPLSSLSMTQVTDMPLPPQDCNIVSLPFSLAPTGSTFDPPLTFTWTYDPEELPEGAIAEELVLAYYDEAAKEWIILECVVDTETFTVAASVSHFTDFALLSPVSLPPSVPKPVVVVPPPKVVAPVIPPVVVPTPTPKPPTPLPLPPAPPAPPIVSAPADTTWIVILGSATALMLLLMLGWLLRHRIRRLWR